MKPPALGTLFDLLADRGSRTAVHLSRPFDLAPDGPTEYDIGQLADLVRQTAARLAASGVRAGDRVAVVKPNHWDTVLLACAASRLGAVPALLSPRLSGDALRDLLRRLDPALLVTTATTLTARPGTDLTAHAARTLLVGGVPYDGPAAGEILTPADVDGHAVPPVVSRAVDDTMVIHHTSGTTGLPKLVEHSTRTIVHRLAHFECNRVPVLASRRSDTVATADPFTHGRAVPWTISVLHLEPRAVVLLADRDPRTVEQTLLRTPPTTLEASPAAFVTWRDLAARRSAALQDVRLYISTFDAVHPPTVRGFLAASRHRQPRWLQGWGQTETGPLTFRLLTRKSLERSGERHPTTRDLGRPVPGRTRLRVVDPQTLRPVGRGRPGLLLARTKARCVGYVGEQDRWATKADGPWWNTGDIGVLTRGGSLILTDREVDTVPGASCVELEDVIEDRLAEVVECTVLGVPGPELLPVLVTADGTLDPEAWAVAVRDLPAMAEPVVREWDEVPRTETGKVRRLELRRLVRPRTPEPLGTGRWT
ncbi:class I adenylate-forming enzyme family protein [Streptomyces benahoarensis]|uniref:Acyl--CoA ligase n=1 Tax=Streptomyces benahoarensis TaxID=2595054 RepID=A0A553ZLK5_9ACTN|nr:class I adenylate-forming enzyme family protein [Streptomyces benahoarensis]TSB23362.1 acyl--CoA ligase [Streptomyces benahoarensis]TSB42371.1 acyl--CoA ligase [Streptomyces benahoarensis]